MSHIILIPNNATPVAEYKLKGVYDNNLRAFHKVCRVEQSLIQQVVKVFNEQYIIYIKNRTTVQFTGNIRQIFAYLLTTYGKISQIHLNYFEK